MRERKLEVKLAKFSYQSSHPHPLVGVVKKSSRYPLKNEPCVVTFTRRPSDIARGNFSPPIQHESDTIFWKLTTTESNIKLR